MYPSKAEREQVAFFLIRKYPFLADAIGTGIVSQFNKHRTLVTLPYRYVVFWGSCSQRQT